MSYIAPVKISNPGSQHVLPLYPKQGFQIVLDGTGDDLDEIEFDSPFFVCDKVEVLDSKTIYNFLQSYDLSTWILKSKFFLGEIIIRDPKQNGKITGTVCVHAQCSNKNNSHILTIIEPSDSLSIKVSPEATSVFEIVIYDKTGLESWSPHVIPGSEGFSFELIKVEKLNILNDDGSLNSFAFSNTQDIYLSYPRCTTFKQDDLPKNEIHYWYRISDSKKQISSVPTGLYPCGKIVFDSADSRQFKSVSIDLNVKKQKQKVSITNGVAQVGNSSSYIDQSKKLNKNTEPQTEYDSYDGWYEGRSYYNHAAGSYTSKTKNSNLRAEIEIEIQENSDLGGENVIYFR